MNEIKVGDYVEVSWENLMTVRGTVIYKPMSEGDCWHISGTEGNLHYVQRFSVMTKCDPPVPKPDDLPF